MRVERKTKVETLLEKKLALYQEIITTDDPSESEVMIGFELCKDPDIQAYLEKKLRSETT